MIFKNKIFIFHLLLILILYIEPASLKAQSLEYNIKHSAISQNTFGAEDGKYRISKNQLNLNAKYNFPNFHSNISFTIYKKNKIAFDETNFSFKNDNMSFGIGKTSRHWSFSPFTSLILSNNTRPASSVFFNLKGKAPKWFDFIGNWSIEAFNSQLTNTNGPKNSMMLGTRLVFNPINQLNFELIRTSQWGGEGHGSNLSDLVSAAFSDSNSGSNSNVNQMAGFGFSYIPKNIRLPLRLYAQAVGEDEAGGFPSCYLYLSGLEWSTNIAGRSTQIGLESIDTRVNETQNGNCGKNTAYNNSVYKYTNYDIVLGAPIDTESKSISIWAKSQLSKKIHLTYSLQNLVINDKNLFQHRLSSSRQKGWIHGTKLSWKKNNIDISGNLYFHDIILEKINITKSIAFGINTSIKF